MSGNNRRINSNIHNFFIDEGITRAIESFTGTMANGKGNTRFLKSMYQSIS